MALRNRGGTWHFRFNLDGREYAETTGLAATKQNMIKAQQIELEYRQALLEGRHPTRRILIRQFSDAAKDFLEWAEVEHRDHPNSYLRLATSFASLKEFFGCDPVSVIDEARIEAYKTWRVKEHEIRDITLRHDLHALSKFFGYAMKQHWTRNNPVKNVEIPSDADAVRMHILSDDEEQEYFKRAAKNKNLHDVGRLMLNQGMRPEEVTSLQKNDINLERGQLLVRKGKTVAARRTLDLMTESRRILARLMNGKSRWLFPSKRKPGGHVVKLNNAHDTLCERAAEDGKPLNFVLYDLRHTFATRMAEAGVDLATLAALLGHSSLRIVQKYVHPTAEHKRSAMLKYDLVAQQAERKRARKQSARPN